MRIISSHWVMGGRRTAALFVVAAGASLAALHPARAQYFGRNKVQYEHFDFRILPTQHYEVYFYPAESLATADAARMAERWYSRLVSLLRQPYTRNPIIFYADPADFQQTNVIDGFISQGTGGVTEGLRERVIMPHTGVYAETDHVLGHELVHVSQYRIAESTRGGLSSIGRIPLWLIEGMAEYLSVGRVDPNTAMWLRDAMRRNDLPTLAQLTNDPRFFPYRYGQALWAYVGGRWGDEMVNRLFREALRVGWEPAVRTQLGMSADTLSRVWHEAIRAQYGTLADRTAPDQLGRGILPVERDGDQNVSPVVSPDGRLVAFFSSRSLFGIDLFVADANTGRIVRQLTSVTNNPHFDALSFINSAGSWSPDGQKLAVVAFADGGNEINLIDAEDGDVERRIRIRNVGAISDPAWSPDGRFIAFSGMQGGVSDLYLYDLTSGTTTALTNDREAQLQPAWSPDGRTLAFATDRGDETDFGRLTFGPMRIALMDVATRQVRLVPRLGEGKSINPQFSPDGASVYFISDQDGVSDIYRMSPETMEVTRLTRVATGISGITDLSPALSVARQSGDLVFSIFHKGGFGIRKLTPRETPGTRIASVDDLAPLGILPPGAAVATSTVGRLLSDPLEGLPPPATPRVRPYESRLTLDYIGGPQVGVAFGGVYGAGLAGGIGFGFSDMLGNHIVNAVVQAQGEFKDLGAQAFYLNRTRRLNWGGEAYRIPYLGAFASYQDTVFTIGQSQRIPGTIVTQTLQRVYFDNAQFITQYPFSTTRRLEFSAGVQRISFDTQVDSLYVAGNTVVRQTREGVPSAPALAFTTASVALVGDNSFFAFTSPVAGGRYRFEATPYFGTLTYQTLLADYRRYLFARPFTFAVRGLHFGRYGGDAEHDRLQPLYVGHPTLIRGYDANDFGVEECTSTANAADSCPEFSRLNGSRIAVVNAELRIPLFGTERFGLLNVPFLPLEIAPFADAGLAWSNGDRVDLRFERQTTQRVPVVSAGVSARINLFGFAIGEVYWVNPFQRPGRGAHWAFQLSPGW